MAWSLFDNQGRRKYLTAEERAEFIRSSIRVGGETGLFCLTIALTGARISEVLQVTQQRIDEGSGAIIFETLKRRRRGTFRAVPVPGEFIDRLRLNQQQYRVVPTNGEARLWGWSRTTAWKRVKAVMKDAGISEALATPRALRHTFAVVAIQEKIALSLVQKWLGHAKIETTAIYAAPVGPEERALAKLTWNNLFEPPNCGHH
jgi:integrase/recombinase XerD